MLDFRWIFLKHEVTKRHGFIQVEFRIILINIAIGYSFDAVGFRIKVDNDLLGIGINHEEAIYTRR